MPEQWSPSTSYPWLDIANHFGLEYSDVLLIADFYLEREHDPAGRNMALKRIYASLLGSGYDLMDVDIACRIAVGFFRHVLRVGMSDALSSLTFPHDGSVPSMFQLHYLAVWGHGQQQAPKHTT